MNTINLKALHLLNKHFASKEKGKYNLQGVFVEHKDSYLVFTASDGLRLVTFKQDYSGDNFESFIMPSAYLQTLKFTKKENGEANLTVDGNKLTIEYNGTVTTVAAVDEQFPDYRRVIPASGYEPTIAHYNNTFIADNQRFAKAMGFQQYTISQNGNDPAFVDFGVDHCFGIIMPMRSEARNSFSAF